MGRPAAVDHEHLFFARRWSVHYFVVFAVESLTIKSATDGWLCDPIKRCKRCSKTDLFYERHKKFGSLPLVQLFVGGGGWTLRLSRGDIDKE